MAKKKKLSAREEWAKKTGKSKEQYPGSSSPKEKESSKDSGKFKKFLKESRALDAYQRMDAEQQKFLEFNWNMTRSDAKEDIKLYQKALEEATTQADPYWKSYLLIAQDEVQRSVDEAMKTTQSEVERNQRLIERLNENLTSNKEYLSLEQQSDLANIARNYEVQNEQVVGGAAEAGLTFSTKRKIAEQRLAEAQTGLVESTQRKYNKQIRDLETEAASGSLEAKKRIEDLQRRLGQSVTSIGREAEAKLGTENIPAITGYTPLGDVTGELYERKVEDIAKRQQTLFAEKARESLTL